MTTELNGRKLYKVLVNGRSCHGGDLEWSLPTQAADGTWTPGEWHEVDGETNLCSQGLHLTWEPARWGKPGMEVYEVEAEDLGKSDDSDCKVVARRARLLRRVTDAAELLALCVALAGTCEARGGYWFAYDSATVEASGSATVEAYGSATVRASGSATVRAYDSATVEATCESTVIIPRRYSASVKCTVADNAVLVDRRGEKPICTVGGGQ